MKVFLQKTGKLLRRVLLSVPTMIIAGVAVAYVLGGFFLAPAVVKWQLEKQVRERLAHELTLGELRFNPLKLTAEANEVELRDAAGAMLISFRRLFADFEARSVIDRAWTFAVVDLERPTVHVELDKEGTLNFLPLIEALRDPATPEEEAALPRLLVRRLTVQGGRAELVDQRLAEPLITRAMPVDFELTDLSTLPSAASPYRLSARTATGATVRWRGVLRLNPLGFDGRLALNGFPTATIARALHEHVSIGAPAGKIDLGAEYRFAYEAGTLSGGVDRLEFKAVGLSMSAPDGASPLFALEEVTLTDARLDLDKREIIVPKLALKKGRLALRLGRDGRADWQKLLVERQRSPETKRTDSEADAPHASWAVTLESVELSDMAVSVADDAAGHSAQIAAVHSSLAGKVVAGAGTTRIALERLKLSVSEGSVAMGEDRIAVPGARVESAALSLSAAGSRAEVRIERPQASLTKLAIQQGATGIDSSAWSFGGQGLKFVAGVGKLDLAVDAPKLAAEGVTLRHGSDRAAVQNVSFEGKHLSVGNEGRTLRVGSDSARLAVEGLALERGEDSAHARNLSVGGKRISIVRGGAGADPASIQGALQGAAVTVAELVVKQGKGNVHLLRVEGVRSAAETLTLSSPQEGVAVAGGGLSAEVSGVIIRDPRTGEELARIGRAQLAGGVLRSREPSITAESILVADGGARVALDTRGRLNWAGLAQAGSPHSGTQAKHAAAEAPGWRVATKTAALKNFGVAYSDARYQPAIGVALHGIEAKLDGVDTGTDAAAGLDLRAKLRQGGELAISGKLDPRSGKSDLKVKVSALDLAPVQPYLAEFANLALASGVLSAEGRLRYADPAAGAQLVYEGAAAVEQLLTEETKPRRPFASWGSVAAEELKLTVRPHSLEILELRVTAPEGRLILAEDQSPNFARILKEKQAEADASSRTGAQAPADEPFPVSVARIRVDRGVLEFADHSLKPRFGTRMHELKGVITGFGTAPDARARVQVDARVDKYGLAKIEGEINALRPQEHTDVDMTFRNLEMTALTPYVAKFAGYRIADGKLSVDLKYRIQDGQLVGNNRIVLEKLKLGEKVESPGALDLPLDLAIALLQDSDGVIDVRLPVKGNLQDPQFDYGEIIGKAFGNLLGGIVTAPFRALAALFGDGAEDLDSIDFEPGIAALAPPERDKLSTVSRALKNRPQLRLIVDPVFAPGEDLAALRSAIVRRELVTRMGFKLAPGEEPGPIDVNNARAQRALEAMFAQRYSSTLLEHLKLRQAEPEPKPATLHRVLLDRLISEQPVAESALRELATRRGAAIVQELTTAGGVEPSRILLGKVQAATESSGKSVTARLALGAEP